MKYIGFLMIAAMVLCSCRWNNNRPEKSSYGKHALQMTFEQVVTRQYRREQLRFMLRSPRVILDEESRILMVRGGVWTRLYSDLWEGQP